MNTYATFYNQKTFEVTARNMFEAKDKAIAHFQPPKSKRHMVSVVLMKVDGREIIHSGASLP